MADITPQKTAVIIFDMAKGYGWNDLPQTAKGPVKPGFKRHSRAIEDFIRV